MVMVNLNAAEIDVIRDALSLVASSHEDEFESLSDPRLDLGALDGKLALAADYCYDTEWAPGKPAERVHCGLDGPEQKCRCFK